jgi:hypothetical protein
VIVALQWALESDIANGSEHEIWLDEITFYSETAPEGAVR